MRVLASQMTEIRSITRFKVAQLRFRVTMSNFVNDKILDF